jgi:CRP-like cAMP-binding protein/predicted MFS family arabinose efflux permease
MTVAIPTPKLSPFAVFRKASFTRMWLAQLISTIGDSFTMIAAGILIFQKTGSALSVGLMLMATSIPTLLIGMIAGVFVDRFNRKKIMIVCDLSRGVLISLIPILIRYNVVWMYVIVFLSSAISTFFSPAYDSIVPEMASDEELTAANSMIAISSFGSTAVGFAASGLLAAYSINLAFVIDAATFFISALLMSGIRIAPLKVEEKTSVAVVVNNLQGGLKYMFNNRILRSIVLISIVYAFMVGLGNTLLLPFATKALGATTFEYGLQEGLTSIGFVIGSLIMARFAYRLREGLWVIIGLLGMGLAYITYSFSRSVPFAIFVVTISGMMNSPYAVARRTLLQRNTDREIRGRVFGANMTISSVMMLLGMAAAGLADIYGPRLMMQITGLINLATAVVAILAPGIGRPAAEWIRSINLLRKASLAPRPELGRAATLADFDRLVSRLPALSFLSLDERKGLVKNMRYLEAAEGSMVVKQGETSDSAFFIVDGGTVAGREENSQERILEVHSPGDFFGEIAALTGIPRTANVVTRQPSTLLRVPAATLREMSKYPVLNRLFLSKMTERMMRMDMIEMPKRNVLDQQVLRDLRTSESEAAQ